ncbi:mechanosensitive ion channel family protein [Trebonia sp.]|uniref:mechanosensitive ion channel family protein n=1 Tax=Trebonia sp. TaxID=2767075 RepID=UPI0026156445|nr:mechanosensitive ion channel family protein [Trebonia sp.]
MVRHVQAAMFGTDHAPDTLTGSCGGNPGIACRLVWDVTHDGQLAGVAGNFLAGPVHLLLRVGYVIVLALIIRAVLHRLINRITERAADTILPHFGNGVSPSLLAPGRLLARRRHGGAPGGDEAGAAVLPESLTPDEAAAVAEAENSVPAERRAQAPGAAEPGSTGPSHAEVAAAAARAERALLAERRHQRVLALGSILRSATSVTIFSIAGCVVLGDLGINLAPLLASAGVVGIAIGFGAQNLVRDYLSGIFMLLEDQYGVGDVITVGDATGTVETVTLRITRLRDINGIVWHVRNGAIEQVGNESQGWARAVIDFPVPYTANLSTIRTLLSNAAGTMWSEPPWRMVMLEEPEVWGAQEVSSDEITMRIVVKTAPLRQWEVEREMRARVKAALDAAGIGTAAEEAAAPAPAPRHRQSRGGERGLG